MGCTWYDAYSSRLTRVILRRRLHTLEVVRVRVKVRFRVPTPLEARGLNPQDPDNIRARKYFPRTGEACLR